MDALSSKSSRFVKHGPCESCGSKDNVAWYSNGTGYCFGCRRFYLQTDQRELLALRHDTSSVDERSTGQQAERHRDGGVRPPPDDMCTLYRPDIVSWFKVYNLSVIDLLKYNVYWSSSREQVIYVFYGESKDDIILWQARNFRNGVAKAHRFFTTGVPNETVAAYYPDETGGEKTAIIVEDCVSAIKVAKAGFVGVPAFGSGFSDGKLKRLCGMFDQLVFWLDYDKYKESQTLARKAGMLGANVRTNLTVEDPKYFTCDDIKDLIHGRN